MLSFSVLSMMVDPPVSSKKGQNFENRTELEIRHMLCSKTHHNVTFGPAIVEYL